MCYYLISLAYLLYCWLSCNLTHLSLSPLSPTLILYSFNKLRPRPHSSLKKKKIVFMEKISYYLQSIITSSFLILLCSSCSDLCFSLSLPCNDIHEIVVLKISYVWLQEDQAYVCMYRRFAIVPTKSPSDLYSYMKSGENLCSHFKIIFREVKIQFGL